MGKRKNLTQRARRYATETTGEDGVSLPAVGRPPLQLLGLEFFVREEFSTRGNVFGTSTLTGVVLSFGYADFPAVFEPAELLELFDSFESPWGSVGYSSRASRWKT